MVSLMTHSVSHYFTVTVCYILIHSTSKLVMEKCSEQSSVTGGTTAPKDNMLFGRENREQPKESFTYIS